VSVGYGTVWLPYEAASELFLSNVLVHSWMFLLSGWTFMLPCFFAAAGENPTYLDTQGAK